MGAIRAIGGITGIAAGLLLGSWGVSILDGAPSGMLLTYGCIAAVVAVVLMKIG